MDLTDYHCKYIANDLTRKAVNGQDRLSMSLFNASVDLNPHQIEEDFKHLMFEDAGV
jgi:hypothetical protein